MRRVVTSPLPRDPATELDLLVHVAKAYARTHRLKQEWRRQEVHVMPTNGGFRPSHHVHSSASGETFPSALTPDLLRSLHATTVTLTVLCDLPIPFAA